MRPSTYFAGLKHKILAAKNIASNAGLAYASGSLNGHQMLGLQSRLFSPGTDITQMERTPCQKR
jgi:hypothetical protein